MNETSRRQAKKERWSDRAYYYVSRLYKNVSVMRRWAKTSKIKLNMATSGTILSGQLYETSEEGQRERVPSWEGKQRWFRLTNQKSYSTITCSRFHYLHSPTKIFSCFLSLPASLYCFCLCRTNSSSLRWPLVFYAQFVWKLACRYINRIKNIVSRISRFVFILFADVLEVFLFFNINVF